MKSQCSSNHGVICGLFAVEEITDPFEPGKVRFLDKLVDEFGKGREDWIRFLRSEYS